MIIPKGRLRGKYDAAKHILLTDAAEKAGYHVGYFSNRIAPAYRIQSFTDGHAIFYDKAMFNDALTKMHTRVGANGAHIRGKLPTAIKKKVRSDFGKPRKRAHRRTRKLAPAVIAPSQNGIGQAPVIEVVVTRAMLESLISKGKIKPKLIVTD